MKKKALVIRFSSIGDIILITPTLRGLANNNYEVDLLTHTNYAHVLEDNPYIIDIIPFEGNYRKTASLIKSRKYDVIIDLHKSIRSYIFRLMLFRKFYGFEKLRVKRWWRTKTKRKLSPDRHIALRFIDTIRPLGITYDQQGLNFFIKKSDEVHISNEYDKHIALIIGARFFTKTFPIEKARTIILEWPEVQFHLLGGEKEKESTWKLSEYKNVINHCGALTLSRSASVIDKCDHVISTDTGLMHIAAALGKSITAIFGGTVKEFGFYPFMPDNNNVYGIVENLDLDCRPCSKSGKKFCPKGHFKCMNDISTNEIHSLIKKHFISNHL